MKRWFMSYVQSTPDGRFRFGTYVYFGEEHPVTIISQWNDKKNGDFKAVLLSFKEVTKDTPDFDDATNWLGG
jgi:hypothetical protein